MRRLVCVLILVITNLVTASCSKDASREGTSAWMDVTVEGDARVSLWRFDGDPLRYYETNAASPTVGPQYFGIYTSEPVTIRLDVNQSGPVSIDIIAWHIRSGGIMDSGIQEVDQHAIFTIDEARGTTAEVTVTRDRDFHDLRLRIDRDRDGTADAEHVPIVTTDE